MAFYFFAIGKFGQGDFCLGELLFKLLARVGERKFLVKTLSRFYCIV